MSERLESVYRQMGIARVIPILTLESSDSVVPTVTVLHANGLPIVEITFRSEYVTTAIHIIREQIPELLIGAGTVLSVEQVKSVHQAGGQFIVSPGFNPAVVEASLQLDLPIIPGINNPTGIEQAMSFGLGVVKFFPAEASGGVSFLKAMLGPYPTVKFLPTGGISSENLTSYLALPNVLACAGSWITASSLVRAARFDEIAQLATQAIQLARRGG